jgi:hypothetical protein
LFSYKITVKKSYLRVYFYLCRNRVGGSSNKELPYYVVAATDVNLIAFTYTLDKVTLWMSADNI